MTKPSISIVLFSVITIACSSSTTTQSGCTTQECLDELNGTGGQTSSETSIGGSIGGSDGSIGGSFVSTVSVVTGGSGSTGTTTVLSATGGQIIATGGNSSATTTAPELIGGNGSTTATIPASTGGSSISTTAVTGGSPTTTATCVPRTCDQILPAWSATTTVPTPGGGAALLTKPTVCGMASDGCGGMINCGTCTTDGTPDTDCGQAPTTLIVSGDVVFDFAAHGLKPIANVCGTRCVNATSEGIGVICTSTVPPLGLTNCTSVNSAKHIWKCSST